MRHGDVRRCVATRRSRCAATSRFEETAAELEASTAAEADGGLPRTAVEQARLFKQNNTCIAARMNSRINR